MQSPKDTKDYTNEKKNTVEGTQLPEALTMTRQQTEQHTDNVCTTGNEESGDIRGQQVNRLTKTRIQN